MKQWYVLYIVCMSLTLVVLNAAEQEKLPNKSSFKKIPLASTISNRRSPGNRLEELLCEESPRTAESASEQKFISTVQAGKKLQGEKTRRHSAPVISPCDADENP